MFKYSDKLLLIIKENDVHTTTSHSIYCIHHPYSVDSPPFLRRIISALLVNQFVVADCYVPYVNMIQPSLAPLSLKCSGGLPLLQPPWTPRGGTLEVPHCFAVYQVWAWWSDQSKCSSCRRFESFLTLLTTPLQPFSAVQYVIEM